MKGELTLGSFSAFIKAYKSARRNIAPSSRPSDAAEVEMVTVIAVKDSASRELFELKTATTPPTDLDSAAKVLTDMLRGRVRCEEIDEIQSGRTDLGLSASSTKPCSGPNCDTISTALAAAGIKLQPAQMEALVTALAPADPRYLGAGKDKPNVPRDKDGKPNRWVEGMALCRCGINGGKHLFKDCPKKKEKEKKEKKALAAAKAAPAAADESEPKAAGTGPTEDQIRSLLSALFTASVPTVNLASADGATSE